jgi:hypothetical protein
VLVHFGFLSAALLSLFQNYGWALPAEQEVEA